MRILSFKPGHDGAIASIANEQLEFSLEAEKDSFPRYFAVTPNVLLSAFHLTPAFPDIVCISGWERGIHAMGRPLEAAHSGHDLSADLLRSIEAGYYGHDLSGCKVNTQNLFGKKTAYFTSTHERSHLLGAYGMSPFPQGQPCYALVWEGHVGSFYLIDENVKVHHLGQALEDPGTKYSFLFSVADPSFPEGKGYFRFGDAGKLMALAAFSDRTAPTDGEKQIIDFILSRRSIIRSTSKVELKDTYLFNAGVESNSFKSLAGKFSDAIFDRFYSFARQHLKEGFPLLISGGCGLNCEWNTKWLDSGLFQDVFVPPCANDSGSAIGTAVDAQLYFEGKAKISWSVYAGLDFVLDTNEAPGFKAEPLNYQEVADFIKADNVIAWVQGRYEIGPRALGNRSLLANPLNEQMLDRLNRIKQRESYRPIAPVCLEEDLVHFTGQTKPSPYMLFFHKLTTPALPAVTHVDNSARFQTVNDRENPPLRKLLTAFKQLTGYGVLCNTSLNFRGQGFINRLSDLVDYAKDVGLDGFVVGNTFFRKI